MFKFDLLENEKLETMVRQTEWVLLKPVCAVFVLIYIPWYFLIKYELVANFTRWLLLWTAFVFVYGVYKYLVWLLNVYLVTNKRVVCVNYESLARKRIAEAPLDHIANITVSTAGFFAAMFGYGEVEIHMANIPQPLVLKNVRGPSKVKDRIWKLQNKTPGSGFIRPAAQVQRRVV